MKKLVFISLIFLFVLLKLPESDASQNQLTVWSVQSIDTMKYSRDLAREKLKDASFDKTIDTQVRLIAETGATHVAIGTPYDDEFLPFLTRWVESARRYNLNVWFRGNFSGWEHWFGYSKIDRNTHLDKTRQFILNHTGLFADGDIFTPCPECENGGPGDPRRTGDTNGFREFLVTEYKETTSLFDQLGKSVTVNYSMNGDVANLVMDRETTKELGGVVVIDHYVATVNQLINDIRNISTKSGGKVILGEFGVPIPDIHGQMTPEGQKNWLSDALNRLSQKNEVAGLNYWTSLGSSTQIWNSDLSPRPAVRTLTEYYHPKILSGRVVNVYGGPIKNADVSYMGRVYKSDAQGTFRIPVIEEITSVKISANGFMEQQLDLHSNNENISVALTTTHQSPIERLIKLLFPSAPSRS